MTISADISLNATTYALVVGIEKYQAGSNWDVPGAANDAINFANWLLKREVPPENIHLFVSPLDRNWNLLDKFLRETELKNECANRDNIVKDINCNFLNENVTGKLLYVFWGGHGYIIKSDRTQRLLWYTDSSYENYESLNFNSLQEALKNSGCNSGFLKQVYFIDACANRLYDLDLHSPITRWESSSSKFGSVGSDSSLSGNHPQYVLFASAEHEVAENQAGGGSFSQAVMEELNKLPPDCFLPDMEELTKNVETKLEAEGKPKPVYKKHWNGSEEEFDSIHSSPKINWREICHEILAKRQRLTSNLLTLVEGINLQVDDVYVSLGLVERKKLPKPQNHVSPEQGSELYKETEITKTFTYCEFLEQVLKQKHTPKSKGKQIAIIGEPGSGKTTLLQQIAKWVHEKIEDSIVIWVSLAEAYLQGKELQDYLFKTWLDNIAQKRENKAKASKELVEKFISQFNQGRVWLLLDGLDEMSVERGNPITEIARQIREGGVIDQARIVLTCRVNLWNGSINSLDDFDTYRTLNFSYPKQVEEFIHKFFAALPEANIESAQRLCTVLEKPGNERIQDLIKNPLRLTLLCLIWQSGEGELSDTQAGLYKQFVDEFYKWKQDKFATNDDQRKQLNTQLGELAKEAIDKKATPFLLRQDFISKFLGSANNKNSLFFLVKELGLVNQVGIDEERNAVYAFFHPSFQEYFAAKVINDWDYFLPRQHKDKPVKEKDNSKKYKPYRIFEPQWKQPILLWLGQSEENLKQQKQEFINALLNFKDGCDIWRNPITKMREKGFYEYRAYFLAAAGIAEFKDCDEAKVNEIITQIFNWKNDITLINLIVCEEPEVALQETNRKQVITKLVQLLQSKDMDSITALSAIESLGKIGTGNETAIAALVQLLQSKVLEFKGEAYGIRWQILESLEQIGIDNETAITALVQMLQSGIYVSKAAFCLGKIAIGNEKAITALVQLLQSQDLDNKTRRVVAFGLRLVDPDNKEAITALVQLLQSQDVDVDTRRYVAGDLGEIGTDNETVIAALVQLLQSQDVDTYIRHQAAKSLGQIDRGNETAIAALVQLLQSQDDDAYIRYQAAESLWQIDPRNEKVIPTLVELLQSQDLHGNVRRLLALSLGEIDPGNEKAITTLVELLQSQDIKGCPFQWIVPNLKQICLGNEKAISTLVQLLQSQYADDKIYRQTVQIETGNEKLFITLMQLLQSQYVDARTHKLVGSILEEIGTGNKYCFTVVKNLSGSWLLSSSEYRIIWKCTQNMPYPTFYQAWHQSNLITRTMRNRVRMLRADFHDQFKRHSAGKRSDYSVRLLLDYLLVLTVLNVLNVIYITLKMVISSIFF